MTTTHEQLLADVERFMKREGMAPSRFSWLAVRDPTAVSRLRKGKGLTVRRADQFREFMAQYEAETHGLPRRQAAE